MLVSFPSLGVDIYTFLLKVQPSTLAPFGYFSGRKTRINALVPTSVGETWSVISLPDIISQVPGIQGPTTLRE